MSFCQTREGCPHATVRAAQGRSLHCTPKRGSSKWCGRDSSSVYLYPSCPSLPRPQHSTVPPRDAATEKDHRQETETITADGIKLLPPEAEEVPPPSYGKSPPCRTQAHYVEHVLHSLASRNCGTIPLICFGRGWLRLSPCPNLPFLPLPHEKGAPLTATRPSPFIPTTCISLVPVAQNHGDGHLVADMKPFRVHDCPLTIVGCPHCTSQS